MELFVVVVVVADFDMEIVDYYYVYFVEDDLNLFVGYCWRKNYYDCFYVS